MPLTPEALLSVFKSIDLDDSGTIELRELEAFCAPCLLGDGARQSSAQQSRITELFAQVDTDGSGLISFDEFCRALNERLGWDVGERVDAQPLLDDGLDGLGPPKREGRLPWHRRDGAVAGSARELRLGGRE